MKALRASLVAPFAIALAMCVVEWPLLWPVPEVGDNFLFWAIGRLVVSGRSPYDAGTFASIADYGPLPGGVGANTAAVNVAVSRQTQIWSYPPQTGFLFAPFGALPYDIGVPLFHLFVFVTAFAAVSFVAWRVGLRGVALTFALVVAVASEPFVIAVRNGHPLGLVLIGAMLLLDARRIGASAAGAALVTFKPHLVVPVAVFAAIRALLQRDVRRLAALVAAGLAITLPFELLTPFPPAAIASTGNRFTLDLSTTPALARDLGGGEALAAALMAVAVGACALAVWWTHGDERMRVTYGALFALSLALLPYAHDYDLFIALPAMFVAISLGVGRRGEVFVALISAFALLVSWLLFFWWPLQGEPSRIYQGGPLGAVPIIFAVALAACAFIARVPVARAASDLAPHAPQHEVT